MEDEYQTYHPRPNTIAAAMYTLRDLEVDCIILHGPSGCNFKTSRYLEEEGIRCFTTNMGEREFIFGGSEKLIDLLEMIRNDFDFKTVAIVGSCASMIIGEDLESISEFYDYPFKIIPVNVHCGFRNNTEGVIQALEAAEKVGLISSEELERQKDIMRKTAEVELKYGMASMKYISPSRGDDVKESLQNLLLSASKSGKCILIFNPKKELGYIFADILFALTELFNYANVKFKIYVNLDENKGLKKIRADAKRIKKLFQERGLSFEIIGGLDEYAIIGNELMNRIKNHEEPVAVIGYPQGILPERNRFYLGITNGPREVVPLRKIGYSNVLVEMEAHPKVIGMRELVESYIGNQIRKFIRQNYV